MFMTMGFLWTLIGFCGVMTSCVTLSAVTHQQRHRSIANETPPLPALSFHHWPGKVKDLGVNHPPPACILR